MAQQTASFREAAAVAADSLRSSKLRSFLTLLGIILATTTLIAVMSMIHGMDVYIANSVSSMGSDGFRIVRIAFLGNFDPKKFLEMQKKNPQLSPDEFEYLKDRATLVSEFGMSAGRSVKRLLGIANLDQDLPERRHPQLGRAGQHADRHRPLLYRDRKPAPLAVAVIGADVKNNLFGDADPIGKTSKSKAGRSP